MKTKDFINYIEGRGGHVNDLEHYVSVWDSGNLLAVVSSDQDGKVNIEDYDRLLDNNMFQLIAEYCTTPLDMREEGKKRYIRIYDSVIGYLNISTLTNKMSVNNQKEADGMKTKFTDKDIEQLKKRDDIPLDWNKVKLEDAD